MVFEHGSSTEFTGHGNGEEDQRVNSKQRNHEDLGWPADDSWRTRIHSHARTVNPAHQNACRINHDDEQRSEQPERVGRWQHNLRQIKRNRESVDQYRRYSPANGSTANNLARHLHFEDRGETFGNSLMALQQRQAMRQQGQAVLLPAATPGRPGRDRRVAESTRFPAVPSEWRSRSELRRRHKVRA